MSMESRSTKSRRRKPPDVFPHLLTRAPSLSETGQLEPSSALPVASLMNRLRTVIRPRMTHYSLERPRLRPVQYAAWPESSSIRARWFRDAASDPGRPDGTERSQETTAAKSSVRPTERQYYPNRSPADSAENARISNHGLLRPFVRLQLFRTGNQRLPPGDYVLQKTLKQRERQPNVSQPD